MPGILWTQKELEIVKDCLSKDESYLVIANRLSKQGYSRSAAAIKKYVERQRSDGKKEYDRVMPTDAQMVEDKYLNEMEKVHDLRKQYVDLITEKYIRVGNPVHASTKILCLSDLHLPFVLTDVVDHALKHHGDADYLIINGDFFEGYMISKWPKRKSILLRVEYEMGIEYAKLFSKKFKKVIFTAGNHEHRLQRYFSSNIDPAVMFLTSPDMLQRLVEGYDFDSNGDFKQMHEFNNLVYSPGILNWYTNFGKAIFAHPDDSIGHTMVSAETLCNSFLEKEDFQALIVGHTHRQGKALWKNRLLIEQGCCCVPLDYEARSRRKSVVPTYGYCVVYLDREGNVDFNLTNTVYYGTGSAVKVDNLIQMVR